MMWKTPNYGWALKDTRTGTLCQPNFYETIEQCRRAQNFRANYGHETIIVSVVKTWLGRVKEQPR